MNPDLRSTVAVACHTLQQLGDVAVFKGGCNIYIGTDNYYFLPGPTEDHDYLEDFTRCILALLIALMEGYSARDAVEEYKKLCREYEKEYELMGDPVALTAKTWMEINRMSIGIRGEAAGGVVFGINQ